MTIEKAVSSSLKGYIDDPEDIDEIISRLLIIRFKDLMPKENSNSPKVLGIMITDYGAAEEQLGNVSLAEMLCMINGVRNSPVYPEIEGIARPNLCALFMSHLANVLMSAGRTNTTVHLFMFITVSSYFNFLGTKVGVGRQRAKNLFQNFRSRVRRNMEFTMEPDTTIGKLLKELTRFQQRQWNPCRRIKSFEKSIMNSFDHLYELLIKHFQKAYPECFDLDELRRKYAVTDKDDVSWDNDDEFKEVS